MDVEAPTSLILESIDLTNTNYQKTLQKFVDSLKEKYFNDHMTVISIYQFTIDEVNSEQMVSSDQINISSNRHDLPLRIRPTQVILISNPELAQLFIKDLQKLLDSGKYYVGMFENLQQCCAEQIKGFIAECGNSNALTSSELPLIPVHLVEEHFPEYRDGFIPTRKRKLEDEEEKYEPIAKRTRLQLATRKPFADLIQDINNIS